MTSELCGFLWTFFLLLSSAAIVHVAKLAFLGLKVSKKRPEKAPPPKPEPVYFLVERKKKRPKKEYAEPKQINFQ